VEVDDVLQDTYMRAFQSVQQFEWRGSGTFRQWLGGIAENVIKGLARHHFHTQKREASREVPLSQRRRTSSGGSTHLGSLLAHHGTSPSKGIRRNERLDRLEAALGRLSEDHREVIILARLRDLPIKEIAKRMGRSADAVSMLLLRALRELKGQFGSTESLHLPSRSLDPGTSGLECQGGGASEDVDDRENGLGDGFSWEGAG
jgi:RNA polymerase sigma-70 factor (ECF subfamily)